MAVALASAAPQVRAADEPVTLNFVNADIDAVVKAVAEITGRNFVVDPKVKGTVNIISARPVPRGLVYPTLLSALRLQGFAAVEGDGVTKIVPEADAKQQGAGRAVAGGWRPPGRRRSSRSGTSPPHSWSTCCARSSRPTTRSRPTRAAMRSLSPTTPRICSRIDKIVASLDQPPGGRADPGDAAPRVGDRHRPARESAPR